MYNPYEYITKKQEELNKSFPLEKRKEMILGASKDKLGNSVVFYRHMTKQHLDTVLNNKIITHENYIEGNEYDIKNFYENILIKYFNFIGQKIEPNLYKKFVNYLNSISNTPEEITKLTKEIIKTKFEITENIEEILSNRHTITKFVGKYLEEDFIKKMHAGSLGLEFSPYFSWSIGGYSGNFANALYGGNFYLEAIIPDNDIITNPLGFNGEKEILTTKMDKDWITRIYTDRDLLALETLGKDFDYSNIALRNYYIKNKKTSSKKNDNFNINKHFTDNIYDLHNFKRIADRWRFDTKTELYLPI